MAYQFKNGTSLALYRSESKSRDEQILATYTLQLYQLKL